MTGEIFIADKTTLDAVKADTTALLQRPSGVNYMDYFSHIIS
jgi:hypothetical protein